MAVDYRIPLGVQAPEIPTPGQMAQDRAQAQALRDKRDADMAKRREEADVAAVFQSSTRPDGSPDYTRIINTLASKYPARAMALQKDVDAHRASAASAAKAELDADNLEAELVAQALQRVKNANDYAAVTRMSPAIADAVGPEYDPERVALAIAKGTEVVEYNKQQNTLIDRALKGDGFNAVAGMLSLAKSPEMWEQALAFGRVMGVTDEQLGQFGQFSPEGVQRAGQLSMTPDARADNARADQQQAETARSNREDEAVARGNLGVAQGNLGVARGNLAQRAKENESGASSSGLSIGDQKLVDAVIKNPALYAKLTPTVATRIAAALSEKGFNFDAPAAKGGAAAKDGPNVSAIINQIETLSGRINTLPAGPMSTAAGLLRGGRALANMDNDVSEYNSLVEGMIPMVARAVGHTGVLTQQDVDSVRALFPKVGDNKTLAQNKLQRVKELIAGGAQPPSVGDDDPLGIRGSK